jgi:hypothetical protein
MRPIDGSFESSTEVDELRWVELERAPELLDYQHDRELVRSLIAALASNERPGS